MTTVTVEVTQADIDHGEPGEPCACPVAHAIFRVLNEQAEAMAEVSTRALRWSSVQPVLPEPIPLPQIAQDFIARFDTACSVEPFSFTLDIPADLLATEATS